MTTVPDLQLPSLPEVTLRALDACRRDDSYRAIGDIAASDSALVVRILALANSAQYGPPGKIRSLDQALARLGTRRFQTLVLTDALRQILFELSEGAWQQLRDFWQHTLATALTAKALATLTRYPEADEAFMLGMLHNVGELVALKERDLHIRQGYMDQRPEIAASLVTSWGMGPLAADAMRYQLALPSELKDASHLVKIISLASRLALFDSAGIAAAGTLFGINETLAREINRRISHDVNALAQTLKIPLITAYKPQPASQQLRQTALQYAIAQQALNLASPLANQTTVLAETVDSLALVAGLPALYFGFDRGNLVLLSGSAGSVPHLEVTAQAGGSALTEAFSSRTPVNLSERTPNVLDHQLLAQLRTSSLVVFPVVTGEHCPGAFVLGTSDRTPDTTAELARLFVLQLASALQDSNQPVNQKNDDPVPGGSVCLDQLRRQVHEISNPLTIVRQYIYNLRTRLDDPDTRETLDTVQSELDRAGKLLLQISDSPGAAGDESTTDIDTEVQSLARMLNDSLFTGNNLHLKVLTGSQPTLAMASPSTVRQILMNLIRNAVESLPESGGTVTIKTSAPVWQGNRSWVEMTVVDTGPGISATVKEDLFAPGTTTKDQNHSGLGLSIVKQLVDELEGIVACQSGADGTRFRLLLPASNPDIPD